MADEEINKDNKWYELHALQQKSAIKNIILHSMYTYKKPLIIYMYLENCQNISKIITRTN